MSPVQRPARAQVSVFASAKDFRDWLEANHDRATELFVGFYRKGAGKAAMTYAESVDEALCYGWIDGITYKIDEELRATRFTPRRRTSGWSAVNIAKIAELTKAGRMHPAGARAFEERDKRKDAVYSYERPAEELPAEMLERFEADDAAWVYWQSRPASFRRQAVYWILSAKRPETRERRFASLVDASRDGRMPAPWIVSRDPTK
jgi:uncharacterized protein YdeI (YjbR/CyaY-like superfamily)